MDDLILWNAKPSQEEKVMICLFKPFGFNIYKPGQSLQHVKNHSCWFCEFTELEKIPGFPGFPWDYLFDKPIS